MIYLILAILCSAGVSIFMRASEKYCQGHYGILLMNYVVCVLAGLILTGRGLTQTDGKGMPVTIVFGVVTGLLYCGSFILLTLKSRIHKAHFFIWAFACFSSSGILSYGKISM